MCFFKTELKNVTTLSLVCFLLIKHWSKGNWGKKWFIWLTCPISKFNEGSQGTSQAKAMEECCLLVYSTWLAQPAFLYNPWDGTAHSRSGQHQLLIKNMPPPHRLACWQVLWRHFLNFPTEVSSFQMTVTHYKFTKSNQHIIIRK